MKKLILTDRQIAKLEIAHRAAKKVRDADRIKTIALLADGWTPIQVAKALFIDDETVRNYLKRYQSGGIEALLKDNYKGFAGYLSEKEEIQLDEHLEKETYLNVHEIVAYVKKEFKVKYSVSGMTDLLYRLGYVYKKPKVVPSKANREEQEAFIRKYEKLKETKQEKDPIYFMDGTHPQHNTIAAYGWIKKGVDKEIKSNSGRQRLNINGAINIENQHLSVHYGESINAQSTISLFKKIEAYNKEADTIYAIADNARYYRAKLVNEYLETSKIEIIFLPPYSPNLNLIERLWKYFKKNVLYNEYYEKFEEFKLACKNFIKT